MKIRVFHPSMAGQPNTVNEANNSMAKVMEGLQADKDPTPVFRRTTSESTSPAIWRACDAFWLRLLSSWLNSWSTQAASHFVMRHFYWQASWAWQTPKSPWRQLKCWASCNCKPRVCKRTWPVCRERKSSITCFTLAILHDIHDHSDIQIPLSRLRNFNLEKWRVCVSLCTLPCHPCPMKAFEGSKFHNPDEAGT